MLVVVVVVAIVKLFSREGRVKNMMMVVVVVVVVVVTEWGVCRPASHSFLRTHHLHHHGCSKGTDLHHCYGSQST